MIFHSYVSHYQRVDSDSFHGPRGHDQIHRCGSLFLLGSASRSTASNLKVRISSGKHKTRWKSRTRMQAAPSSNQQHPASTQPAPSQHHPASTQPAPEGMESGRHRTHARNPSSTQPHPAAVNLNMVMQGDAVVMSSTTVAVIRTSRSCNNVNNL